MLNKKEGSYSPEAEAAIVDLLKGADRLREASAWWNTLTQRIQPRFGLYFAEIERLCRRHELSMYLFAVHEESAFEEKPDLLAVDPNNTNLRRRFVAMLYPEGLDDVLSDAKEWGMLYEPTVNLANLEEAGICMPIPGSEISHSITAGSN